MDFERIGAILGAAFDNDAITGASVDKNGANRLSGPIPCHISYKTVDDPDSVTIIAESRVPLELYVQLNFALEYKGAIYNKDYLTLEKRDSEGNVIATMTGRIGAVTVRQARCVCLVDVFDGGATPTPPEPEPEPQPEEVQLRMSDGEGGYGWTMTTETLRMTFYDTYVVLDMTSGWYGLGADNPPTSYVKVKTTTYPNGTRVQKPRFRKKANPSTEYVFSEYVRYNADTQQWTTTYTVYA